MASIIDIITIGPEDNTTNSGITTILYKPNQFDEHGSLIGVTRLVDEKNWEYKRRIKDAFVHIANSSYQGLVYGITRELGLSLFDAITINPKRNIYGEWMSSDPYIVFDGVWLLLYADYANNDLRWAIDRYQPGGNYEHLGKLVDLINTTDCFEASLGLNVDPYTRSMTVLNQSNRNYIKMEFIPQSTRFVLKNKPLVRGTVFFADRETFKHEVTSVGAIVRKGQYYIDYTHGIVTVYTIPQVRDYVRYSYIKYPFTAIGSPVILHNISNENFKVKMFEQILQDDGTYAHWSPTELGVDIINELMSVVPMYWGI